MIFLYLRAHHHLVLIMSDTSNRLNVAVMLAFDAYMAALRVYCFSYKLVVMDIT